MHICIVRSGCTLEESMALMNDAVACWGGDQETEGRGGQEATERGEIGGGGRRRGGAAVLLGTAQHATGEGGSGL